MKRLVLILLAATLPAAVLAQRTSTSGIVEPSGAASPAQRTMTGEYRLTGEVALLPSRIGDDGERTYLEWGKYQSLPAVFGIGANGEEEVVDAYMREGVFTIDRVYAELVFRIDKKRARARRTAELGTG